MKIKKKNGEHLFKKERTIFETQKLFAIIPI